MKTILQIAGIIGLFTFLSFKVYEKPAPKDITKFLTEAADARMMDAAEGRLAAERGTTGEIRKYGVLMMKDQAFLLIKIRELAESKNIALPKEISKEKSDALKDLEKKYDKDFDRKFLSMIKIDHKRDVGEFKDAAQSDDPDLSKFAKKHLPLIESHLAAVEKIKEEQ